MTRLVALYPQAWRDRYEDEFLSLLVDRPPDSRDRLDIARGALDARLHPQASGSRETPETPGGPRWSVRAGWLTLIGAPVWTLAWIVAINGPTVADPAGGSYRDGAAALPLFFLALALLGTGITAVGISLPERAIAGRAGAYVACLIGFFWAAAPWLMWFGLIAAAGLVLMGVSAWRTGRWPATDAALLVVGQTGAWLVVGALLLSPVHLPMELMFLFVLLFTTAWLAVGHALLREGLADATSRDEIARP